MDHATLVDALRDRSAVESAAIFRVTRRTIYRWCKRYGIRRRIYRCPNAELLRRLEENRVLQKKIARTFGVSRWTIWRWCLRFGIAHHTTGRFRKGTKGNVRHIHEEMPFGIGIAFGDDLD
jgi:transposase